MAIIAAEPGSGAAPPLAEIVRLESALISAWPSLSSAMDGRWLARFARGFTKRANSVQCLDPADDENAPDRLARMADLYALNAREPIFRVTPLAGPAIVSALAARGAEPVEPSLVLTLPFAADFAEAPVDGSRAVKCYDATDRNWIEGFADLTGMDRRPAETMALLLGLIAHRQVGLLIRDAAGDPAAAAIAVDAAGTGIYHNVVVRPDLRGQGFGRAIMSAALDWTRSVGARHAALQVVSSNAPARRLYGSLGFGEAYGYHYRYF